MGIGFDMEQVDWDNGWLSSNGYWYYPVRPTAISPEPTRSELGSTDGHLTETEEELAEWLAPENYWRWLKYQVGRGKIGGPWDGEVKYL